MRANNRGKVKKKHQCFIYNPTPDYKSNKNYLQKIKAHEFIVLLSFCPFIVHEKSCCTDPVKKPTLSKSYKVT